MVWLSGVIGFILGAVFVIVFIYINKMNKVQMDKSIPYGRITNVSLHRYRNL
ncbi:MAG: hypothetical protein AB1420_03525 [Bacillota bacterium]